MAHKREPTSNRREAEDFAQPAGTLENAPRQSGGQAEPTELAIWPFLHALFSVKPAETFILIWRLRGKQSHWYRDLAEAAAFAERSAGEDVYVGAALSPNDFGPQKRCTAEQTAGISALWIDLDFAGDGHKKLNLPPTAQDALGLIPPDLPASLIIHSGHGLQAWWIFPGPWVFRDDSDRERAADLARRFNRLFQARAGLKGWDVDSVADLARVMRVPGTTNCKISSAHVPVKILDLNDRRYTPQEIQEHVSRTLNAERKPAIPAPTLLPVVTASGPLMLDPEAHPPAFKFELLWDIDGAFRRSWTHERRGMLDQSPSAYDQSLANLAAMYRWTDQEITDLLIAHRREHGVDLKLRQDYYQITIGKARTAAKRRAEAHLCIPLP